MTNTDNNSTVDGRKLGQLAHRVIAELAALAEAPLPAEIFAAVAREVATVEHLTYRLAGRQQLAVTAGCGSASSTWSKTICACSAPSTPRPRRCSTRGLVPRCCAAGGPRRRTGRYRRSMEDPDTGAIHTVVGEYRGVRRPRPLVYSWSWEGPGDPEVSTVTVDFVADGECTVVRLEHAGLRSPEAREQHRHGREACVDNLGSRVLPDAARAGR